MKTYSIEQAILHITYVCSHHCPMCYANAGNNKSSPSLNQLFRIVDRLSNIGVKDITLVGGDPAAYSDIVSLVQYIKSFGIRISVLSNTLDFLPQNDAVLEYIDVFEGTIHHSEQKKHDEFCGCFGAYAKLLSNLKFFSDHGKSVGLAINMIPFNYNVIYDLISNVVSKNIKVDHIIMQRIIQYGRAAGANQYELTKEMLDIILPQVEQAEKDFKLNIVFEDPLPLCSIETKYQKYMHPCEWGLSKVSVDYNGALSRCGTDVFHSFGNVFDDKVLETWNTNPKLREFREKKFLPAKCRSCPSLEKCGGGCPISRRPDEGFSLDYLAKLSAIC